MLLGIVYISLNSRISSGLNLGGSHGRAHVAVAFRSAPTEAREALSPSLSIQSQSGNEPTFGGSMTQSQELARKAHLLSSLRLAGNAIITMLIRSEQPIVSTN